VPIGERLGGHVTYVTLFYWSFPFNSILRNPGDTSCEFPHRDPASCPADRILRSSSRAGATQGTVNVKIITGTLTLSLKCQAFDTDLVIKAEDTESRFLLTEPDTPTADRDDHLSTLLKSWDWSGSRQQIVDSLWVSNLEEHLTHLVDLRVAHVDKWLTSNTKRFQEENASMDELRRAFNSAVIDLRASMQLCKSECDDCNKLCIRKRLHEGDHNCLTTHDCIHNCTFCDKKMLAERSCGQM
jgi:hypothetical protein